jgi:hypothetical protein
MCRGKRLFLLCAWSGPKHVYTANSDGLNKNQRCALLLTRSVRTIRVYMSVTSPHVPPHVTTLLCTPADRSTVTCYSTHSQQSANITWPIHSHITQFPFLSHNPHALAAFTHSYRWTFKKFNSLTNTSEPSGATALIRDIFSYELPYKHVNSVLNYTRP